MYALSESDSALGEVRMQSLWNIWKISVLIRASGLIAPLYQCFVRTYHTCVLWKTLSRDLHCLLLNQ